MKGCLFFVGGLILGFVIGILALFLFVITSFSTGKAVTIPTPVPGQADIAVTVSENYLNRQINNEMSKSNVPLLGGGKTAVNLQPNNIVTVTMEMGNPFGGNTTITIKTQVLRDGSKVQVKILEIQGGSLSLPVQINQMLEKVINDAIDIRLQSGPASDLEIMDMQSTENDITVKIRSKK